MCRIRVIPLVPLEIPNAVVIGARSMMKF